MVRSALSWSVLPYFDKATRRDERTSRQSSVWDETTLKRFFETILNLLNTAHRRHGGETPGWHYFVLFQTLNWLWTEETFFHNPRTPTPNQLWGCFRFRWLKMWLDSLASVVVFAAAVFELVSPSASGGGLGLSVSYAFQVNLWAPVSMEVGWDCLCPMPFR